MPARVEFQDAVMSLPLILMEEVSNMVPKGAKTPAGAFPGAYKVFLESDWLTLFILHLCKQV